MTAFEELAEGFRNGTVDVENFAGFLELVGKEVFVSGIYHDQKWWVEYLNRTWEKVDNNE